MDSNTLDPWYIDLPIGLCPSALLYIIITLYICHDMHIVHNTGYSVQSDRQTDDIMMPIADHLYT